METLKLDDSLLKRFSVARTLKFSDDQSQNVSQQQQQQQHVTFIDFSFDGTKILASFGQDRISIHDLNSNYEQNQAGNSNSNPNLKTINCFKYGVDLARFGHAKHAVIHASAAKQNNDHDIRYVKFNLNLVTWTLTNLTVSGISPYMTTSTCGSLKATRKRSRPWKCLRWTTRSSRPRWTTRSDCGT